MSLKKQKRSPAEGELPFEYDWQPAREVLTAYAGIPLFVRAARSGCRTVWPGTYR
ncbi:MAG: hypothetical protein IPJ98_00215 [Bryobacterales bacterium]|nr:hypothetical protein [Bryobacterales bacterium]